MAYWIFKALLSPLFFLFWRVRVEGREHVPADGAVVLAANHQSFCDSFFLPLVLRRRVTFLAKAEYFDSWKTAWFFRAAGQIPINREGGDRSQRALETAVRVLSEGRVLAIYPEGTRSPDPRLHRGRTGVVRLSRNCGVPVIPVGIAGTRAIQPPGSMVLRPFRRVTIRFGAPLASTGTGRDPSGADPEELRELTDTLMAEIAQLSGQEYVDEYARRSRSDERSAGPAGSAGSAGPAGPAGSAGPAGPGGSPPASVPAPAPAPATATTPPPEPAPPAAAPPEPSGVRSGGAVVHPAPRR